MAGPDGSNLPGKPKRELTMEQRLLVAFALMGVVLFLTQFFYPQQRPPVAPPKPVKQVEAPKPAEQAKPPESPPEPVPPPAAVPQTAAAKEETFTVDTQVYRIEFSNRGAVVRNWWLKKYLGGDGKLLNMVNTAAVAKTGSPFALAFNEQQPPVKVNEALYAATPVAGGLGVTYEFSDGKTSVRKTFRFGRDSYLAQVTSRVTINGSPLPHLFAWRGGVGDLTAPKIASNQHSVYYDPNRQALVLNEAKVAKDGPVTTTGPYTFAGVQDNYFAAVFLSRTGAPIEIRTFSDTVAAPAHQDEQPMAGAAVGGQGENRLTLFVGPKDMDLLRVVEPKLVQLIDFGKWFGFLARPLFLALNWVNDNHIRNFGWSIIVVTVIINFLLLPLRFTSVKSMKKMQSLQPQVAAINAKYRDIGMRDPRKAQQNQEMMELYKKHGVNPMGGCVPMVLQIPFFIAFYTVLTVAIELRGATWLWVTDLSQPENLPIRPLPLLMIGTQFLLQKMTPSTTADPAQQRIMMLMPLFMGFLFYGISSGLVLYWLTGNLVSIAQQWVFNRTLHVPAAPPVPESKAAPKRKTRK